MTKPILCLDFDGTIHAYNSGWHGSDKIMDAPIAGAFDFIEKALNDFDVHIFSARSGLPGGVDAMKAWFIQHGWAENHDGEPKGLEFPTSKPPAHVSIDDRAINFSGVWPEIQTLKDFKPWNELGV